MWISCRFPSGGYFKYLVRRYDTKLEFAFSNDDNVARDQIAVFNEWIKRNHKSSNGNLFKKLETLCLSCITGKELITKMNTHGNNS